MSDISTISKKLIYKDAFYGHFALGLDKSFDEEVGTACVALRGLDTVMKFCPKFWAKLTEPQKIGLMMHELMHIVFFDLIYFKDFEDRDTFNIAADLRINQYIPDDMLPPGALKLEMFKELNLPKFADSRTYYNMLKKDGDKSQAYKNLMAHLQAGKIAICSHNQWADGDEEGGHGESVEKFGELAKKQIEHVVKQVYEEQLNKNAGNLPQYLRDFIAKAYEKKEAVIDWKGVIRTFGSACSKTFIKRSRNKPNDRFPDNAAIKIKPK